jgi:uncharacterized membrane protein YdjX (TVP38/TMEM64 family)
MTLRSRKCLILAASVILVGTSIIMLMNQGGLSDFADHATDLSEKIHPLFAIVLMAILPALGFPITPIYLAAGLRFGSTMGFLIMTACTFFHIFIPFVVTRKILKNSLGRWLTNSRHKLPPTTSTNAWFISLLAALFPGIPYFMRNYLLAMTEVPFKVALTVCWPIYALRSFLVIYAGDVSHDWTSGKITLFIIIYGVKLSICGWLVLRLKASLRQNRNA